MIPIEKSFPWSHYKNGAFIPKLKKVSKSPSCFGREVRFHCIHSSSDNRHIAIVIQILNKKEADFSFYILIVLTVRRNGIACKNESRVVQYFCQQLLSNTVENLPGSLVVKFNSPPEIKITESRLLALTSYGMIYLWRLYDVSEAKLPAHSKISEWKPWFSHNLLSYDLNDIKIADVQLLNIQDGNQINSRIIWAEYNSQVENMSNEFYLRSISVADAPEINAIKISARTTLLSLQNLTIHKMFAFPGGIWMVFLSPDGAIIVYLYIFSSGWTSSIMVPSKEVHSNLILTATQNYNTQQNGSFIGKNSSLCINISTSFFIVSNCSNGLSLKTIYLPTLNYLPTPKHLEMIVSYESSEMALLSVKLANGVVTLYHCNLLSCSASVLAVISPKITDLINDNMIGLCDFSCLALVSEYEATNMDSNFITITCWNQLNIRITSVELPAQEAKSLVDIVCAKNSVGDFTVHNDLYLTSGGILKAMDFLSAVCDKSFALRCKPLDLDSVLDREIDSVFGSQPIRTSQEVDPIQANSHKEEKEVIPTKSANINNNPTESISSYLVTLLSLTGSPLYSVENTSSRASAAYPYTHQHAKQPEDSFYDHSYPRNLSDNSPIKGLADEHLHPNSNINTNNGIKNTGINTNHLPHAVESELTAKDMQDLLDAEKGSNLLAMECINDELNLQHKSGSRRTSFSAPSSKGVDRNNTMNDLIVLTNYASLPNLSSGCSNTAYTSLNGGLIWHDIDMNSSHWLDFLDILTLHPAAEPANHILSKYIDYFQLPVLIESLLPTLCVAQLSSNHLSAKEFTHRMRDVFQSPDGIAGNNNSNNNNNSPIDPPLFEYHHFSNSARKPVASESLEVLLQSVLLGPSPQDLYLMVVGLMDMVASHTLTSLDTANCEIELLASQAAAAAAAKVGGVERMDLQMSSSDLDLPLHSLSLSGEDYSPMTPSPKQFLDSEDDAYPNDTARNRSQFNKGVVKARASRFESPPISSIYYSNQHQSSHNNLRKQRQQQQHDLKNLLNEDSDEDDDFMRGSEEGGGLSKYRSSFSANSMQRGHNGPGSMMGSGGSGSRVAANYQGTKLHSEVIVDPHHRPVIQRCCDFASSFISLHVTQNSKGAGAIESSSSSPSSSSISLTISSSSNKEKTIGGRLSLNNAQQDALLQLLLRGGRRLEAAEALIMWGRSVSLFALCLRVAASSNVTSRHFNLDASNDFCYDHSMDCSSLQQLSYYRTGRGKPSVERDTLRCRSFPVQDPVEAAAVPVWAATYGTRWAVNTSRLDVLLAHHHNNNNNNNNNNQHPQRGDIAASSNEEYGSCYSEDFTLQQLRLLEAAVVFEKTLVYFLQRECEESVSFLISLFEFRPLGVPIPAIASIYDKYAPISIKRAGIWECMIAGKQKL